MVSATLDNFDNNSISDSSNEKKGNAPVDYITVRGCHIAVWQHETPEGREYHQISVSRLYTDKDGNTKNGQSFSVSDIPNLILALQETYKKEVLKN